ncbi:MAG: hypothetical protein VX804_01545 [Candidatus Thermoplasmatota archaeon]|nr:hypothetical protein [Candidatus Thermoplasmatota archaeon]|tara:strand:+ start:233 stop:985 length:753 start_codon:yes stop_codon:yes gene_type:complete
MPARVPNAAGHTLTLEDDAATGGPLTNSGARTAGGLENIGTATSNTFTMTEVIKIKETVNVPASTPPVPGTTDGLETAAGPVIKVKSITLPSSYQGDTLSFSHASSSGANPTNFTICPDIKISVEVGTDSSIGSGVGFQEATATITGSVKELDDWVLPWSDPVAGIPKFNGSDFATTKSAGYGRENGIFFVTFVLEYGVAAPLTALVGTQEVTWKIGVINNADNDKDVYIQKYNEAYGALTKVPELDERQ